MSPLTQLLQRQEHAIHSLQPALWLLPPADLPPALIRETGNGVCFVQDERVRSTLDAQGLQTQFGCIPDLKVRGNVVLCLPREKERFQMLVHSLASAMGDQDTLWVAGENRAGAKSALNQLTPWFHTVRKKDAARHCVLYEASEPRRDPPFELDRYARNWTLEAFGNSLSIRSYPGVFAHGSLDPATDLLLDALPGLLEGRNPKHALDLGCGAGVLGAALLAAVPELAMTLTDTNALALAAARETLAANNLDAQVLARDGLEGLTGRFDLVVSNPPFHVDHREREDRGAGLFRHARNFLNPHGQWVVVANRHLPWPAILDAEFGHHELIVADNRFQLLRSRRRH